MFRILIRQHKRRVLHLTLIAGLCVSAPFVSAISFFASPADTSLIESSRDRIVLEVHFGFEDDPRSPSKTECYLAFPPRQYNCIPSDFVCALYDKSGCLLQDGYVPGPDEIDSTSRQGTVSISRGICHDRHVARLGFSNHLTPLNNPESGNFFNLRSLRVTITFTGELDPAYELLPRESSTGSLGFEPLFQLLLVNYESSLGFRIREKNPEPSGRRFYAAVTEAAAGGGVWKFPASGKGIHRIDVEDLAGAGMDLSRTSPESLVLWCEGSEIPYFLSPDPDAQSLSSDSSLFFYDDGEGTDYSTDRVYWLTSAGDIVRQPAELLARCPSAATTCVVFRETQSLGSLSVMPQDSQRFAGVWFRDVIFGKRSAVYSFDLPGATGDDVDLHVGFRNALPEDLVVVAEVNDASSGSTLVQAHGGSRDPVVLEFTVPRDRVEETGNELSLQIVNEHKGPPVGIWEGLYIEQVRVSYWREPRSHDGRLRLSFPQDASGCIRIYPQGFDSGQPMLFQVAPRFGVAADLPQRVSEGVVVNGEENSVFEILQPSAALEVDSLTPLDGLSIRSEKNQADYIVVGPAEFEDPLAPLLDFRGRQGYLTRFVDVQRIYDEFSFGIPDPHAIRDFVRYSLAKWQDPVPSLFLLVGDAFWDYRNRTGAPLSNIIPTYIPIESQHRPGSDLWFAQALEDPSTGVADLPDVFLTRVPAQTSEEVKTVVEKFIAYETESDLGPWRARVLLASDHNFQRNSEAVAASAIPPWIATEFFDYAQYPLEDYYRIQYLRPVEKGDTKTSPRGTGELVRDINRGALLWDYFGHGGSYVLSNSDLFIGNDRYDTDVRRLRNRRRLPFFTSLSCLTGLFHIYGPWTYCLGESLLFDANGAIATFTPTGKSTTESEEHLSKRVKQVTFGIPGVRVGEIGGYAYSTLILSRESPSLPPLFVLMGDPATRMAVPAQKASLRVVSQEADTEGRRVILSVSCDSVRSGTAQFCLYDLKHKERLWESQPVEFSPSMSRLERLLPGLGPEEEGILQVYLWDPTQPSDAAGWTTLPATRPRVSIEGESSSFVSDATGIEGYVALRNQTSRIEEGLVLSLYLDGRLIQEDRLEPLGSRDRAYHRIRLTTKPGDHEALLVLESGFDETDRFGFPFSVPDREREPVPVIMAGTFRVEASSPALAEKTGAGELFPPAAKVRASAQLVNPSAVPSSSHEISFSFDDTDPGDRIPVPALAPGRTHTAILQMELPSAPGEHVALARLYSSSSESAPIQVVEATVSVGEPPDLKFSEKGVRVEPENPVEGRSVRFRIGLANQGNTPAAGFSIKVYKTEADGSETGLRNAGHALNPLLWPTMEEALMPGDSLETSVLWHPADNVGPHRFVVVLDDLNTVAESDESNNRFELRMEFSPGLNTLREQRAEAWSRMDFDAAAEVNRKIARFLDGQLEECGGDRTWLDYDWFPQRAFCALVSGDLERAAEVLNWGIELLPSYRANYLLKVCVELRRGRLAAAKRTFLTMEEEGKLDHFWGGWLGSRDPLYQAALDFFEKGELSTGERLLEKCLDQTPVNSDAWWLLYRVRSDQGNAGGALAALRRYLDARSPSELPGVPWYEATYETLALKLNRPAAAREVIEEAISMYPDQTRFHFLVPYVDYLQGLPATEIRTRVRRALSDMQTLRSLVAGVHLLLVRLDLDMDDETALARDYARFVFHSSKTSPQSGFGFWLPVTPSKWETNPEFRVFTESGVGPAAQDTMAFLLEKSEQPEMPELPRPATMELPITLTLDLGSPRLIDACLIAVDSPRAHDLEVSLSASPDNGPAREEIGTARSFPGGYRLVTRFPALRSRFWHVHVSSKSGETSLHLRDLSLMERIPARVGLREQQP